MDIARKPPNKKVKRIIFSGIAIILLLGITLGLSRMKPAAPSVDRANLWTDTVKRGSMLRQVRGTGSLVPEQVQWIPAATDGRITRVVVLPGTQVKADTVLLEMSNPELELQARDAELQLKAAEAELRNQRVQLENQKMTQEASAAQVKADYEEAKLRLDADEALAKEGLVADINLKVSKGKAEELGTRYEIEKKRLATSEEAIGAQVAVAQAKVDQLRALYELKRDQVQALKVRAGADGVLQQLPVEAGQRVTPGTTLAKVAEPSKLKAELKIAETQAKDILSGQKCEIDTRNGIVQGHVIRIDPAVQNGTVTVDAALDGQLPKGARPDLTVDGTIELEHLNNILYVGRPAIGQEQGDISLFKVINNGNEAIRVSVKLGRSSVNSIEILSGLNEGDQAVLSDMSAYDNYDRIRLK